MADFHPGAEFRLPEPLDVEAPAEPPAAGHPPLGYRSLLRLPGLPRVMLAALLGRTAGQMLSVALVLFSLQKFHSPAIAGVAVFANAFPGVLMSPLAGAILDRRGRIGLIQLDYLVTVCALTLLVILGVSGALTPGLLVGVAVAGSLTGPLSGAGTRSLFPVLVPRHLWDRANAVDSTTYVVAAVVGAPLAATIAGLVGGSAALLATALVFAAAAISLVGTPPLPLPAAPAPSQSVVRDAWAGLVYVARNPALRGLAVSLSVLNLGSGIFIIALPVLVLDHLHLNAAVVGALWALSALAGGSCAILIGHLGSHGRERRLVIGGMVASAAALAGLLVAPLLAVAVAAMLVYGAAGGTIDVGMFSMRQRQTDPAWYGRAFAVSMSLNWAGSPVGSAAAGPLLAPGLAVGLGAATGFALLSAVLARVMVPGPGAKPATAS
ncbi:MAG: MFS transporter [Candidatus Dormibacteria bacterium]|jgi:MFS family permease